MTYITYAPIDRQFGCLERDLPPGAPFNGIDPLDGITFGFALQSRYPLAPGVPDVRFGTVEVAPADEPAILLRVITKAEYDTAFEAEMAAREPSTPPVDPVPYYVPVPLLRQRLEKMGMFDDFVAYLSLNPPLMVKVLTLEQGVDPAYPDLVVAFDAMSVPQSARDYLLANPSVGVPDIPEDLTNG